MKNQNRGQIRTIEAFLSVLVIFSSFAVSFNFTMTQNSGRSEDLASVGFQTLLKLDSDGSLGKYIVDGNWAMLRDSLNTILPAGISYNLTIYNDQMQQVNNAIISNGGFSSQQIAFIEYSCAVCETDFRCYIIHFWLAVAT